MISQLKNTVKNWWLLLIIGIISLVLGIVLVSRPGVGFVANAIIFTIALIAAGVIGIIFVISNRKMIPAWGWYLVLPIIMIICGIITAGTFGAPEALLVIFFGVAILFKGIETICYAISLSKIPGTGWGWTLAGGIILLLFSFFIFGRPLFTAVFIGYMTAFSLIFMGIDAILVSIQLSKVKSAAKAMEKELLEK